MSFWFLHGIPKEGKNFLVLRLGKEEIDFLFFRKELDGVRILSCGSENILYVNARQALEKVFIHLPQTEVIQELVATFDSGCFKAQAIQESFPPSVPPRVIDKAEARSIELDARKRASRIFQRSLFQESGILPGEFSLRRVKILERRIDGYSVPKLEGFKRGEIEFSILGMFLLEPSFLPLEQFAKAHRIVNLRVVHIAEALESFAKKRNRDGIYLHVEEEKTQIAVWKEGQFAFPGDIQMGSHHFTEFFGDVFGMRKAVAEEFQGQYFQRELSQALLEKVSAYLLPEIRKFGTLVKKKLLEAKMALPESIWVFGRGRALRDVGILFSEDALEDLPFSQKPTMSFLLPKQVWDTKNFPGASNPSYTTLCLLGASALDS